MQSPYFMTSDNSNFQSNTSNLWLHNGHRKRKVAETDLDNKNQQNKIFLTEEKLVKNMRTLSLDLSPKSISSVSQANEEKDETNKLSSQETQYEFHELLQNSLRNDDLQDKIMNRLCDLERKKLSMQIVPYMPVHPAQLTDNNSNVHSITNEEKEQENQLNVSSSIKINEIKKENDDHLFKKPFLPPAYTVEEPPENIIKRPQRMKRSYSQSIRSNNNLSVVELKNDTDEFSVSHSPTDYFIFEPSTPALFESSTNQTNSSYSSTQPGTHITECFDFSPSDYTDDMDMQSIVVSDVTDQMDDE